MEKGLFITFEGCDGCGKTTQLELLEKFLNENPPPEVKAFLKRRKAGMTIKSAKNIRIPEKMVLICLFLIN